jgi:predicted metal-binding membrane protein
VSTHAQTIDVRPEARAQLRRKVVVGALLVALAAIAWLATDQRMDGMDAAPGTELGTLGFYVGVWVLMMSAMMFPSITPMVAMYDGLRSAHHRQGTAAPAYATGLFVAGYLAVWIALGIAAYGVVELARALAPDGLTWDGAGRWITGGIILVAAAYQLTPAKNRCLVKCRSPFMFLIERWRGSALGALRLGVEHGAWCVGCCWALMAALFALGVMSLAWMAVIAGVIAAEKLLPWRPATSRVVAVGLAVLGLAVALTPASVPLLVEPSQGGGMHDGMSPGGMKSDDGMKSDGMGMQER